MIRKLCLKWPQIAYLGIYCILTKIDFQDLAQEEGSISQDLLNQS